jgi:hypothetical protein
MAMSVPGATASDMGLGMDLQDQVKAETDEERKKRMRQAMLARTTGVPGAGPLAGASALGLGMAGGSTAAGFGPSGY